MRPLHLESRPGFILIRICSPFWFDFLSTEYPERLAPHCSIRTLPSFSSVSHTPSGELAAWTGAAGGDGATGGTAATTGGGAGLGTGAASCWIGGAGVLVAGCVEVMVSDGGAAVAVVVDGAGEAAAGAGAGAGVCSDGAGLAAGACGSILACSGACLRELSWSPRARFDFRPLLS